MKTTRTLRTLRRAGVSPAAIGFAGFAPSGKRVRRIARTNRAARRLLAVLPTPLMRVFFARGITPLQSVRLASQYMAAHPVVQAAWLQSAIDARGFHAL